MVISCVIYVELISACAGEQLMDKHMNFVQEMVGSKFKDVYGLKSTLTPHKSTRVLVYCMKNFLQIRTNHWIIAFTTLSYPKVTIYDSLFDSVDANTSAIYFEAVVRIKHRSGH